MTPTAESTQFDVGPFVVRANVRQDNPYWLKYVVFRAGQYIGTQFSRPSLSDCRWLERQKEEETDYTKRRITRPQPRRSIVSDLARHISAQLPST